MFLGAQFAPGQDPERASGALAGGCGLTKEPITQAELERARSPWLNHWERGFTDPERIGVELWKPSRWAIGACTSCSATRCATSRWPTCSAWPPNACDADNRTVGVYLPTAEPSARPPQRWLTWQARGGTTKATPPQRMAEAFDASPATLNTHAPHMLGGSAAGGGRGATDAGMRVALLHKATRGRVCACAFGVAHGDESQLSKASHRGRLMVGATLDEGGGACRASKSTTTATSLRAKCVFGIGDDQPVAWTFRPCATTCPSRWLPRKACCANPRSAARFDESAAVAGQHRSAAQRARRFGQQRLQRHGNPYPRGLFATRPTFDEMDAVHQGMTLAQLKGYINASISAATPTSAPWATWTRRRRDNALDPSLRIVAQASWAPRATRVCLQPCERR